MLEIFNQFAHNDVFSGVVGGSLLVSIIYLFKSIPRNLLDAFMWRFTSVLIVFNEDPAFDIVSEWLSSLEYSKKARRLRLTSNYSEYDQANVPKFSPGIGKHLIWYKRNPVIIERFVPQEGQGSGGYKRREDISIRTLGTSPAFMHQLIEQITQARTATNKKYVEIYMFRGCWRLACRKMKRSLESVILPEDQKENITIDIQKFQKSRSWYAQRGIPYRRGFLLYGPPGCGKTSLILAIASHFSKCIYSLNLGSVINDDQLIDAITSVPEDAILLIEDIDAAQNKRELVQESPVPSYKSDIPISPEETRSISLSALLNSIDGVFSRDGRILFMTTNHVEKIDPALMRPGRVDRKEYIGAFSDKEILKMCVQYVHNVEYANRLAKTIPGPIMPAELQQLLLIKRNHSENHKPIDISQLS
jgi:chaperone BCS1